MVDKNQRYQVDLTGFPMGEAQRLELERIQRVRDPNFNPPGGDWQHLKANAAMFKQEMVTRQIPNRIPEHLFARNFLGMFAAIFANDPNMMQEVSDSGNIYRWVQIAGTPYRQVEVTHEGDASRIMFTVPPIFHRTRTAINIDAAGSFLAMIHKAQQVHSRSPDRGNQFYQEALEQFAPRDSREHFLADHVQWLVIFDHYEVPLWDETSKTYKTVKQLRALEGIKTFQGQNGVAIPEPTKITKVSAARVDRNEEL